MLIRPFRQATATRHGAHGVCRCKDSCPAPNRVSKTRQRAMSNDVFVRLAEFLWSLRILAGAMTSLKTALRNSLRFSRSRAVITSVCRGSLGVPDIESGQSAIARLVGRSRVRSPRSSLPRHGVAHALASSIAASTTYREIVASNRLKPAGMGPKSYCLRRAHHAWTIGAVHRHLLGEKAPPSSESMAKCQSVPDVATADIFLWIGLQPISTNA